MKLHLTRPLVFFDLETTGTNVAQDRIVEISWYKLYPNGNGEGKNLRVRPTIVRHCIDALGQPYIEETTMHIPEEATAIHGIHDEDVADCPTFREIAADVAEVIRDCDLAGYNSNHFDVPLLAEEFLRVGHPVELKKCHFVDVFTIFTRQEPRNLTAAYRFYCGKDLTDAHSANADTMATYEVMMAQMDRYPDLPTTIEGLEEFTQGKNRNVDFAGKIVLDERGREVFNFGQHKGKPVEEVFRRDRGYYSWILSGDFPAYTKQVCTRIMMGIR